MGLAISSELNFGYNILTEKKRLEGQSHGNAKVGRSDPLLGGGSARTLLSKRKMHYCRGPHDKIELIVGPPCQNQIML